MSAEKHHHDGAAEGDCRRYLSSLSDYVDGVLSEELCRELEAHVASCENCRIVVNTFSKTVALYHRLPSPDMPNDVKERLYKVLDISGFYQPGRSPSDETDTHSSE